MVKKERERNHYWTLASRLASFPLAFQFSLSANYFLITLGSFLTRSAYFLLIKLNNFPLHPRLAAFFSENWSWPWRGEQQPGRGWRLIDPTPGRLHLFLPHRFVIYFILAEQQQFFFRVEY
jgi:hypothetical protein